MANPIDDANDDPVGDLLDALRGIGRIINSRVGHSAMQKATGLNVSQQGSRLLLALLKMKKISISELARASHLDLTAASRQVRKLETDGYITR